MKLIHESSVARLYLGDALGVLAQLPTASVDAVVTDPPYSSGGMMRSDRTQSTRTKYQSSDAQTEHPDFSGDNRDQRSFAYWVALWMSELRRVVKPGGMGCWFTDWRQLPSLTDAVQAGGWIWRGIVPWDKVVARPVANRFRSQAEYMVWGTNGPRSTETDGAVYGDGVIRVSTVPTAERQHSTQKPVELMSEIIKIAAPTGGVVLDPFTGSGTTGVAAVGLGRKFIGIEMDDHIARAAEKRLADTEPMLLTSTMGGAK